MPKPVTLAQVADVAGVSRATASLVLRDSPRVAEATRARVRAAMEELGYIYDRSAARLRGRRSGIVGLVVADVANPFFAEFIVGAEQEFAEHGYGLLLGQTLGTGERQEKLTRTMLEYGVDGLLLAPNPDAPGALTGRFKAAGIPLVLVSRDIEGSQVDYVGSHAPAGTLLATQHLLDHGCRRLAFLGGAEEGVSRRERLDGFRQALRLAGLDDTAAPDVTCAVGRRAAYDACLRLIREYRPDGVVCLNDVAAFGAMLAVQHEGLRVGADCRVTGFGDVEEAAMTIPGLTTVAAQPRRLGGTSARVLLRRIDEPDRPPEKYVNPLQLAVRGSCGCPQ